VTNGKDHPLSASRVNSMHSLSIRCKLWSQLTVVKNLNRRRHNKDWPGLIKQQMRLPRLTTKGCSMVVQRSNQNRKACRSMSLVNPCAYKFTSFQHV